MPVPSSKLIQALIERLAPSARQARPVSPNPSKAFEFRGETITPPQTPDVPVPSPGVFPEDITKSLGELTPEELLGIIQDLPNPTITRHAPGAVDTSTPLPTSDVISGVATKPARGINEPSTGSGPSPKDTLTPTESPHTFHDLTKEKQSVFGEVDEPISTVRDPSMNPSEEDLALQAFGGGLSKQRLSQAERAKRQRIDEGSLEGEETVQEVKAIQKILDEDRFLKTLSPELQKDVTRDVLIPESLGKKEVDTLAKTIFDEIKALEKTLKRSLPKEPKDAKPERIARSQTARRQLRQAQDGMAAFKKLAAQAAERGRETGDPTEMQSILDRLTRAPLSRSSRVSSMPRRKIREGASLKQVLADIQQGSD